MYAVAKKSRKFPTNSLILTALFVALLAVSARVSFPFFLVPFTLQVLFVLLAGKLCGKLVGGLTVAIYILLGLAGLPFFTAGGGFEYVLKPSFGYIIGFLPAAIISGITYKNKKPSFIKELSFALLADLALYAVAIPYFFIVNIHFLNIETDIAGFLVTGFLVFLPGDIIKCLAASLIAIKVRPVLPA